jgi:hypothetical protein
MISSKRLFAGLFLSAMAFSSISAYALTAEGFEWVRPDPTSGESIPSISGDKLRAEGGLIGGQSLGRLAIINADGFQVGWVSTMAGAPKGKVIDETRIPAGCRLLSAGQFSNIVETLREFANPNVGQMLDASPDAAANLAPTQNGVMVVMDIGRFGFDSRGWIPVEAGDKRLERIYANPKLFAGKGLMVQVQDLFENVQPWDVGIPKDKIKGISFISLQNSYKER